MSARSNTTYSATLVALCCIALQMGCSPPSNPSPPASAISIANNVSTISDGDCIAFADTIESAVQNGDSEAFNDAIHYDSIVKLATDSLKIRPELLSELKRQVEAQQKSERGIAYDVIKNVEDGGSYDFLRVRESNGQKSVVFRLASESGVNYHELFLDDVNGELKATDAYVYLIGERLSDTMRRFAQPLVYFNSDSESAEKPLHLAHLSDTQAMMGHKRNGQYQKAIDIHQELPEELQRDKAVLILRHQAAMFLGDDKLKAALEDLRRFFPDDPSVAFLSIDYFMLTEQYEEALDAIDKLDASVGGDPYLDTARADIVYKQGDVEKAYQLVENAIRTVPNVMNCYWTFLGIALQEKDHDRTLSKLEQLETQFEIDLSTFYDNPNYAEFFESPQGQEWKQRHPR